MSSINIVSLACLSVEHEKFYLRIDSIRKSGISSCYQIEKIAKNYLEMFSKISRAKEIFKNASLNLSNLRVSENKGMLFKIMDFSGYISK